MVELFRLAGEGQAAGARPAPTCWHGEKWSWITAFFSSEVCLCHNCLGRMARTALISHMLSVDVEVSSQFFRGFSHRRKKVLQAHYTVTPHWQVCRGVRGQPGWQDCWSKSAVTSSSHPSVRRHSSCQPPQDKAAGRHGVWPRPPKHPGQFLWNSSHGFKPHLLSDSQSFRDTQLMGNVHILSKWNWKLHFNMNK